MSPVGQGWGSRLGAAPTPPPPWGIAGKSERKALGKMSKKSQGCSAPRGSISDAGDGDGPPSVPLPSPGRGAAGRGLTIWARQRQAAGSKSQSRRRGEQPAMARAAGTQRRWPRLRSGSSPDRAAGHGRRRGLINMEQWDEGRRPQPPALPPTPQVSPWLFWAVWPDSAPWWRRVWHDGGGGLGKSGTKGL